MENKVQRTLTEMKYAMPQNVFSRLCQSGSRQDKFNGTAKTFK